MPTDAAGEGGREADASVELESMSQARAPRHASHKFKHLSSEVSPDKTAAGTGNIARPVEQPNRCH
eukprot:CAMPEP_0115348114 /NCGR_PEP_ID=MMETSP0270-20121206/95243_1 /TAXON_ID=71861 /ORGANISM="Scrippsiella trochoidea, Strain CCMP3099" /LENGTH=65 /DNA_ID=CAMNT_0002770085 /DNA_START=747 /DNA_END=944 /DNA_ORIENTATION=-